MHAEPVAQRAHFGRGGRAAERLDGVVQQPVLPRRDGLAEAAGDPDGRVPGLRAELERVSRRTQRIPYIDPVDVRYRRFEPVPRPVAQAVMFCLMDVSGSMSESMKDLAKRFFLLLHVFLERRYKRVDLVFIRHTEVAEEVTEEVFFTDPRTGGLVGLLTRKDLLQVRATVVRAEAERRAFYRKGRGERRARMEA